MANLTDILLEMGGPGEGPTEPPTPEPRAAPTSQIDPTLPVFGNPTTQSVRQNFATANTEITGLMQVTQGAPFMPLAGGRFTGPVYLWNDPTDSMMPATKGYVDAGGAGGGGGMPEAPTDGMSYGRDQGAWVAVMPLAGGASNAMTGELVLAGNPADALGAVPKQYADAIGTTANAAVRRAGDTMTGLLLLSGDPTAALGAVTKEYADNALALKAPLASPTFTGIVTASNRLFVTGPTNPSFTLYNSTAGQPCYGIYNQGGFLGFGLSTPSTGNPNGSPFATMDQNGQFLFTGRVNVTSGRLISSSGSYNPTVTVNYTSGTHIFGMWTDGTQLIFGNTDATGAPTGSIYTADSTGNLAANGYVAAVGALYSGISNPTAYLYLGSQCIIRADPNAPGSSGGHECTIYDPTAGNLQLNQVALYAATVNCVNNLVVAGTITGSAAIYAFADPNFGFHSGTNARYIGIYGNYSWVFNTSSGDMTWFNGSAGQGMWIMRVSDSLCYNQLMSVGGYGAYQNFSDERGKTDIEPAAVGLPEVLSLRPITFKRLRSPDRNEIGFSAQQVRSVIPEAVATIGFELPDGTGGLDDPEPTLGTSLDPIVAALVGAVQALDARLAAMEGTRR